MIKTCVDAFKNLYIEIKDNSTSISSCCISLPTDKVNTIDFYNDPNLKLVRSSWAQGISPSKCIQCTKTENLGLPSRRLGSNSWYKDNGYDDDVTELIRLDFWTGDTCNLRCVICGPHFSSAWKEELKLPKHEVKSNINKTWKDLSLDKIKYIHFNGGEPLLSKEHVSLLMAIPNKKQVHLNYNTNATVRPTNELLALWEEFKLVQIDFSIDDINERFEYQRYPAKWDDVTDNLKWFVKNCPVNCMFAINTTLSILNHKNIDNLKAWISENFNKNRLGDPIEHRLNLVGGIFNLDDIDSNRSKILEFLNNCDSRRNTNWKTVFPEIVTRLT
jgi:sulfatase maturation enzyme AslB (radical SAM superfamily)